jgi:hypothetical protein
VHEPLDPFSTEHLLPGAPEPVYHSDPPTSGPHRLGLLPRGVWDQVIARPTQVTLLERGSVIVQYRSGFGDGASLAPLAARDVLVTIAPNPALTVPVVATAWTWKLSCTGRDTRALSGFIRAHEGHGPGTP